MAAASQVPAGNWHSKSTIQEVILILNTLITEGVFAGSDTVTTALANLATELATR